MDSKIIILTLLETFWKISPSPQTIYFKHCLSALKGIIQSGSFNLATASENTILTLLKNTTEWKAAGLDNPSGLLQKDGAELLAKLIAELCNASITSGKFPDSLAKLKPVYKKSSLTEASNYRAISLLPLISK